jgi:hypothetical protein
MISGLEKLGNPWSVISCYTNFAVDTTHLTRALIPKLPAELLINESTIFT